MSVARFFKGLLADSSGIEKYFQGVSTSAGASNVNDIPVLNSAGQLDVSFFPATLGSPVAMDVVATGSTLVAGDFVYFDPALGVKQAIATSYASRAMAFVRSGFAATTTAVCYLSGINDQLTGLTKGSRYVLSLAAAGKVTAVSAQTTYTSGQIRQETGDALSTTAAFFSPLGSNGAFA